MRNSDIRHRVEHELLPRMLKESGAKLLYDSMYKTKALFQGLYQEAGMDSEKTMSDFGEKSFKETHREFFKDKEAAFLIRVQMPTPTEVGDCRFIYLCYGRQGASNMIFTSERNADNHFTLCGWDEDLKHFNFGISPDDAQEESDNIETLFWEMMNNGRGSTISAIQPKAKKSKSVRASKS